MKNIELCRVILPKQYLLAFCPECLVKHSSLVPDIRLCLDTPVPPASYLQWDII